MTAQQSETTPPRIPIGDVLNILNGCISLANMGIVNYDAQYYAPIARDLLPLVEAYPDNSHLKSAISGCEVGLILTSPKFAYPRIIEDLENIREEISL